MPSRTGIPQSFGIIMVYALLLAGVLGLVGFAIHKGADRSVVEAKAVSLHAGAEGWDSGLFCIEEGKEDHPSLSLSENPPETCAALEPLPLDEFPEDIVGDPNRGAELYVANGCQVCHGEAGEGIVGPTIAQTGLDPLGASAQYRRQRDGDVMPIQTYEVVTTQDLFDVWTWLQSIAPVDPLVDPEGKAIGHENIGQYAGFTTLPPE